MQEGRRSWAVVAAALATALTAATPAQAGTVYVPLAGEHTVSGIRYTAQVWVSNDSDAERQYSTRFVANAADGTQGAPASGVPQTLAARRSALLTGLGAAGRLGLLELTGADPLFVDAQLVAGGVVRASLPVITSENLIPAGEPATVQGLVRGNGAHTAFVVVNLGHVGARCTVASWMADGGALANPVDLDVPPLTQLAFGDAVGALGKKQLAGGRLTTTCDQPFYTFGMVYRPAAGEAYLLPPAGSASSSLVPPGGGGSGGGDASCPGEASQCFVRAGSFFTTTPGETHRYYKWLVDEGTAFRRVEVTFRMTLNKWDKNDNGFYTMFYLPRNGQWTSKKSGGQGVALLVAREKGVVTAETTVNLPYPQIQAMRDKSAKLVPGRTYDVYFVYDAENRRWELQVKDVGNGQLVVDLSDRLQANDQRLVSQGWYGIQFSDPYIGGTDHVPMWATWRDLVIAGFE